jgi:heavy metal sensor kinase
MTTLPRTLRFRLTVWYGAVLAFLLVLFGFVVYGTVRHKMVHHHDEPLAEMAAAVVHILNEEPDCHSLTPDQVRVLNQMGRLILVHEVEGAHQIFYQSPAMQANALSPQVGALGWQEVQKPRYLTITENGLPWRVLSVPYQSRIGRPGIVRLMENLGDIEETLASLRLTLFLLTPAGIVLSVLGGFWLSGRALAPVDRITRRAMEIEANKLYQRLPETGVEDEIGRLVGTLNRMIARLETSFEAMKRFTADASHELRTPLATLRNTVDVVLDRPRTADELRTSLVSIGEEVDRLRTIVADLLLLARADAGRLSLKMEPLDLGELVESMAETYQLSASEKRIDLLVQADPEARISGDDRWMLQAVGNLMDNALKFTPDGGRIEVEVLALESCVQLEVRDSGPGIPEDCLDRIFERFFQTEASRSHGQGMGTGLGLAITAWIVASHGGRISASNRQEGGARFRMEFPPLPRAGFEALPGHSGQGVA